MQVQIQEVNVETVTKGRNTYQVANVVYTANGRNSTKKLFSFNDEVVFAAAAKAKPGIYDVEVKKDGDYWVWVSITPVSASTPAATPASGRAPTRDYETHDERMRRQVYIVKQSSIANAIALLAIKAENTPSVAEVIETAQQLVDYVFDTNEPGQVEKMDRADEDIPF
jgi:hypothetical protein